MRPTHASYDVIVVGAGPAGTVAAVAHARRGARTLLLEAEPKAARRFAGEWLHPTGVEVLDALRFGRLEGARARSGYGFLIHPDDGSDAIELPYSTGVALSGEHACLVDSLRETAQGTEGLEYVTRARAVRVEEGRIDVEDRDSGAVDTLRFGRLIGADGRRSIVRQALELPERSTVLSYMAAVELRGVELPREGFGHVVLGGPGPALFYRISDDLIRGCLDVPIALGAQARTAGFLWDGFAPVLPEPLRSALRASLENGPSGWAVNRFRPRADFGAGRIALIGDAVGHVHPMTAMGMTMGMLDARALAESDTIEAYAKARRGYIPELLSNALYHCFRREDASASEVRRAMFRTLRADPRERRRTMDILAGADPSRRSFGSAFLKIAAQAVGQTVAETASRGQLKRLPSALGAFGEWMQWPAALLFPSKMDHKVRAESSPTHPIPQLAGLVPTAAPVAPPELLEERRESDEASLTAAIEVGSAELLRELEEIAAQVGSVPDAVLAGPALSSMRAIVSTRMRLGLAARMTLGRRRLAVDGFPRLLQSERPEAAHLSELTLLLLDGAQWDELPIASLAEGARALLDCQSAAGGFVAHREAEGDGDLELTALACRAIDVLARRRPEATDADLDRVLGRAADWLRREQGEDGGWLPPSSGAGVADPISATALGLEALLHAHGHAGEPAARRAVRWLTDRARPEGGFVIPGSGEASASADARALRALVLAGAPAQSVIASTARALAALLEAEARSWRETREIVEALASCEARRVLRPRGGKRARVGKSAPAPREGSLPLELAEDWAFCKESLVQVSRTFARPIELLNPELEVAVSLGYLLCRVADTIEDHPAVEPRLRDGLFTSFLQTLEEGADAAPFARVFEAEVPGDDAELRLARALPRVMRVFAAQKPVIREASVRWVSEMARGMSLYSHRRAGADGVIALHTLNDLERYCYYVAGTVGHLLTDLFLHEIGESPEGPLGVALRDRAEGFATGLQLTNILKDVTDDLSRGVTFVPRSECVRHGFAPAELGEPAHREAAHRAVQPIFVIARRRLDDALEYALTIPSEHTSIRLFCLLPLWMAARTLKLAEGHDAMFIAGQPVKIARAEVEALIAECLALAADDEALRTRYARLYDAPADRAEVAG